MSNKERGKADVLQGTLDLMAANAIHDGATAFFLIAAFALYGPVRRALRIDPIEAVRES
jgi:hypothetical protein